MQVRRHSVRKRKVNLFLFPHVHMYMEDIYNITNCTYREPDEYELSIHNGMQVDTDSAYTGSARAQAAHD